MTRLHFGWLSHENQTSKVQCCHTVITALCLCRAVWLGRSFVKQPDIFHIYHSYYSLYSLKCVAQKDRRSMENLFVFSWLMSYMFPAAVSLMSVAQLRLTLLWLISALRNILELELSNLQQHQACNKNWCAVLWENYHRNLHALNVIIKLDPLPRSNENVRILHALPARQQTLD